MAVYTRACHCSRGLITTSSTLPRVLRPQTELRLRWFTSSRNLGQGPKKPPLIQKAFPPPKQQSAARTVPTAGNTIRPPLSYKSHRDTLIKKLAKQPTLLYQAPSQRFYVWGCYTIGIYALAYSGYHFYTVLLYPDPDLHAFVPVAMGVVCCFTTFVGLWALFGPVRLIRSITASPNHSTPSALSLLIETRRMISLPFMKPKVLTVSSSDFLLSKRLTVASSAEETRLAEENALREQKEAREQDRIKIMSSPFRHMGTAIGKGFRYLRRIWSRDGFLKVYVKGKAGYWRLDRQGCWALEDGKILNTLVGVKR